MSASIGSNSRTSHARPYPVAPATTAIDPTVVGSLAEAPATSPGPNPRTKPRRRVRRRPSALVSDAAESKMRHACVDHLRRTCRRAKTQTVSRRAEKRSAFEHPARNPDLRLTSIVAPLARVTGATRRRGAAVARIPVRRPLPHVSGHIVESVTIRWKRSDRHRPRPTARGTAPGKVALPRIRRRFSARFHLVAPDEILTLEAAARS